MNEISEQLRGRILELYNELMYHQRRVKEVNEQLQALVASTGQNLQITVVALTETPPVSPPGKNGETELKEKKEKE